MDRLYVDFMNYFDDTLKSKFKSIMTEYKIPFTDEEFQEDCYVTFFASNQNIRIPKKKLSKYKMSHPTLKLNYSLERYPNFFDVKKTLFNSLKNNIPTPEISMKPIFLFPNELETKWRNIIISKIHYWINTLFSQTMLMYDDKYSVTLALLMLEVYIDNPDKMFITKLPTFEDLIFVSSNNQKMLVENDYLIEQQVEIAKNSPFFKDKF